MKRTYSAAKQSTRPVVYNSVELEELDKKRKIDLFEARKNYDKLEEDYKFFEKEKHLMIQHVLMEDPLRQVSHNNLMNQSFQSVNSNYGEKNLLGAFKRGIKPAPKQDYIQPTEKLDPLVKEDMAKRAISDVYNQQTDKITALKNFMVR